MFTSLITYTRRCKASDGLILQSWRREKARARAKARAKEETTSATMAKVAAGPLAAVAAALGEAVAGAGPAPHAVVAKAGAAPHAAPHAAAAKAGAGPVPHAAPHAAPHAVVAKAGAVPAPHAAPVPHGGTGAPGRIAGRRRTKSPPARVRPRKATAVAAVTTMGTTTPASPPNRPRTSPRSPRVGTTSATRRPRRPKSPQGTTSPPGSKGGTNHARTAAQHETARPQGTAVGGPGHPRGRGALHPAGAGRGAQATSEIVEVCPLAASPCLGTCILSPSCWCDRLAGSLPAPLRAAEIAAA